jgi:hypothetical protein
MAKCYQHIGTISDEWCWRCQELTDNERFNSNKIINEIQPEQIWNEGKRRSLEEVIKGYKEQLIYSKATRNKKEINDPSFFDRQAKRELRYSEEDIESIITETWIQCVKNDGNNFNDARDGIIKQFKIK